jgi:hypothetical protein
VLFSGKYMVDLIAAEIPPCYCLIKEPKLTPEGRVKDISNKSN